MDEVDGISSGIGDLVSIIKKTTTPIICIANDRTKLKPIINVSIDIKFNRPIKSTIASALLKIAKAENIEITKPELESLCERNGNDIRAILNILEFYGVSGDKDTNFDLFTATQKLIGNKLSMDDAADLVFSDYNMVPLMVQESYIAASRTLEEASIASDFISDGDLIDKRGRENNNWNLLPYYAQSTVAASKIVSGRAPFAFSSWLGKNSKRLKHKRYIDELSLKLLCLHNNFRLDYAEPLHILLNPLIDIKSVIQKMDEMHITRDDTDHIGEILMEKIEIPTKIKTAFTREYNKTHKKEKKEEEEGEEEEGEEGEEEDD
jgi:replication factor C subunit 1